jgi:hypothetical protein
LYKDTYRKTNWWKRWKISFLFCSVHLSSLLLPKLQPHFDLLVTFFLISLALYVCMSDNTTISRTILVYLSFFFFSYLFSITQSAPSSNVILLIPTSRREIDLRQQSPKQMQWW